MKVFILCLLTLLSLESFSQFDESIKEQIGKQHIKEYKIINRKKENAVSPLDNRVMKLNRYNRDGKLEYEYSFNVDVIYTIDSTLYSYDSNGLLNEKVNYYIDYPIGKEQHKFLKEMGIKADTTVNITKYKYNRKQQEIQVARFSFNKLSEQEFKSYDKKGRLIRLEEKYYYLPEENNCITTYTYTKAGLLLKEKTVYPNDKKRVEEISYTYDENDLLIKVEEIGGLENRTVTNKYDQEGRLTEKAEEVSGLLPAKGAFTTFYFYDERGNLIEKKEYKEGDLLDWEKYTYNEKNLITEEFWLDTNSGEKLVSISYEYSFFE